MDKKLRLYLKDEADKIGNTVYLHLTTLHGVRTTIPFNKEKILTKMKQ